MTGADDSNAWMSDERRLLVAEIEARLAVMRKDRDWWRDAWRLLARYRGPDEAEATQLCIAAAKTHTEYRGMFDITLDWLNEARNPAIADAAARHIMPIAYAEVFGDFEAQANERAQHIAAFWKSHTPTK